MCQLSSAANWCLNVFSVIAAQPDKHQFDNLLSQADMHLLYHASMNLPSSRLLEMPSFW